MNDAWRKHLHKAQQFETIDEQATQRIKSKTREETQKSEITWKRVNEQFEEKNKERRNTHAPNADAHAQSDLC